MDLGLRGKVVVVTGGSSGIGFGIVREFLKENCLAAFCSRNEERLASALAQLGEEGYPKGERVMGESVDVRDDKALQAFADAVSERWGRIDVWINQAGAAHFKSLCDFTVEEFREERIYMWFPVFPAAGLRPDTCGKQAAV
jgi:3-oxoacyl-[acyl-carrier protein] reductase